MTTEYKDQAYFNTLVQAMKTQGLLLLSQVQISTDDLPYFVPAVKARDTQLIFYASDKALIFDLSYSEHQYESSDVLSNHWSLETSLEFESGDARSQVSGTKAFRDPDDKGINHGSDWFDFEEEHVYYDARPRVPCMNRHCGSSSGRLVHTYNQEQTLGPDLDVAQLAIDIGEFAHGATPFLAKSFSELTTLWAPTYTFSGPQMHNDYKLQDKKESDCKSLYWSRFAANPGAVATMRKLVKRVSY